MNIADSFASFLTGITGSTFGQDFFIGQAPSSNIVSDSIWWIVASGGNKVTSLRTGEAVKNYQIDIYRRDRDYQTVYDDLQSLEEQLNCDSCTQLEGFETFDIETILFPIDNDLDGEDRKVGLLQATLRIYKEC